MRYLFVLLFVLVACSPTNQIVEEAKLVVVSDDGLVSLEIPTLPEGISLDVISIKKTDDAPFQIEGMNTYKFEPDGLEFPEDVYIIYEVEFSGGIPLIFLITEEGVELVEDIEVEVQGDMFSVKAPIDHFSYNAVGYRTVEGSGRAAHDHLNFLGEGPETRFIGETVDASVVVEIIDIHEYTSTGNSRWRYRILEEGRFIQGSVEPGNMNVFAPDREIRNRPPRTPFLQQTFTIPSRDFTCAQPGFAHVLFNFRLSWDSVFEGLIDGEWVEKRSFHDIVRVTTWSWPTTTCVALEEDETEVRVRSEGTPITNPDKKFKVLMLVINGIYYPAMQFEVIDTPDSGCNWPHYRAKEDDVYGLRFADSLNIVSTTNIYIEGCGFGMYDKVERVNLEITAEQQSSLMGEILG